MKKYIVKILGLLPYLLAIAISLKAFREPDLWWQIRTGEWILANKSVPTTDVFSFTFFGVEWINIKWLFEVMAAMLAKSLGVECVYFLQTAVCVAIVFLLRKIIQSFVTIDNTVFLASSLILILGIEYRVIGRPEMFTHLFTLLSIYCWILYKKGNTKIAYLFIPLQILWANMHEAFGIGLVLMGIYVFSEWILFFTKKTKKPVFLTLIGFCAIAAVLVNPRGYHLLLRPIAIFSQLQENSFTTELLNFSHAEYWQKEAYGMVVLLVILLLFLFKNYKNKTAFFNQYDLKFSFLFIAIAFVVLAFMANRNIVFLFLVGFPFYYFLLASLIKNTQKWQFVFGALALVFYGLIVSNQYYKITNSRDIYGLDVLAVNNPIGAANFVKENNLADKKGFADYLTSSYLLYDLQPNFKTYLDLRDLDVFPATFFEEYGRVTGNKDSFFMLDKKENFQYVVLYKTIHENLHFALYNDSIYACVYADKVAAVYQKTDSFSRGDIFSLPPQKPVNSIAFVINKIFNPFYQRYTLAADQNDLYAAEYYLSTGKIILARNRIDAYVNNYPDDEAGNDLRKKIYILLQQNNIH